MAKRAKRIGSETQCPACRLYHDGPGEICYQCLMGWVHLLESGHPQIMAALGEWLTGELTTKSPRPDEVECPYCQCEISV